MKITESQIRRIVRKELIKEMSHSQDLSKPIPVDELEFHDDGNGQMMFPGPGYSYSVTPESFEQEKEKLKAKYGQEVMISVPNPSYPSSRKIHSTKFDKIQSKENQNFMRHQKMLKKRLGRNPGLGT